MPQSLVHLPNGQTLTVQPVFGGLYFKSNDLSTHHSAFPPGWTVILNSEDDEEDHGPHASAAAHTNSTLTAEQEALNAASAASVQGMMRPGTPKRHHIHRFRKPSLQNDHVFISSISNPSSSDFKPSSSPTRSIAMMLWATLWWYFHQPEPTPQVTQSASFSTPEAGRPKGEWRVNINREGILKGKHLLPKLERMGLIATEDSTVGLDPQDGVGNTGEGWSKMFISRKSFWQMDPRIYLFTLSPTLASSPYPSVSPASSRPASPSRAPPSGVGMTAVPGPQRVDDERSGHQILGSALGREGPPNPLSRSNAAPGPFESSSHLPTFYPPPPLQWTWTNGVRHPVRPKPPRQGETFYTRYIPSLGQYLSFRIASLQKSPCIYRGPTSTGVQGNDVRISSRQQLSGGSESSLPTVANLNLKDRSPEDPCNLTDVELLHKWMNIPRVSHSWGEDGPIAHQGAFLSAGLTSLHSVPVIGCFDGKPFGYFEIYWVKEDRLAAHCLPGAVGEWDRGIHCLVGEDEFRGSHRVKVWLSALVHFCWLADSRTQMVFMEPRVDNEKLKKYCEDVGFYKEGEVTFPHKQSNLLKIKRENWEAPSI